MSTLTRISRSILAPALVVATTIAVGAYATHGAWGTTSVLMYLNPSNADVSSNAAESAILTAMDAWNQGGSPFRFVYGGRTTDSSVATDGKNVVMFRNDANGSVIGTSYSWSVGGKIIESDVVFWDGGFTFFTGTSGCNGGIYVEDVATHELGHSLGLSHSADSTATMYASMSYCTQQVRSLAADDIAGLRSLYGTGSNQPPTVGITTPAAGASFTAPASVSVTASANDADGTVSQVAFFANGSPIGTDATAPYGVTWTNVPAGSYTLTAVATDNQAGTTTSSGVTIQVVTPPPPPPPPPVGAAARFVARDTTTRGTWKGVYGRDGYVVVGDATSLPAGVTITPAGHQTWSWASTTNDVRGLERVTAAGRLAATWYGQTYTVDVAAGSTPRRIALYVVDWDTVVRSERIDVVDPATGNLLDSKTVSGFSNGEYWVWDVTGNVRLRFTMLSGANAVVSGLFVDPAPSTTQPPAVGITSPATGASFTAPATLTVTANASDADGTVSQVAFFANGAPIGTDSTAPYGVNWSNVPAGSYTLTAVATDNAGATTTSSGVAIQVTAAVPSGGGSSSARFMTRDTTTQGTWKGVYGRDGYLIVGDATNLPAGVSLIPSGQQTWSWADATNDLRGLQHATAAGRLSVTWYAQSYTVDVTAGPAARRVALYVVDWDFVGRSQRIDVVNPATGDVLDSRTVSGFSNGEYWVWEVTGDVRFRFTMIGGVNAVMNGLFLDPVTTTTNQPPVVGITAPGSGASFTAPASINVAANASDADGTVAQVAFFANGSPIGTDSTAPYGVTLSNVAAGSYTLTAVATDNAGATTTSSVVPIQVVTSPSPPSGGTTARFIARDTTTQGTWKGVYGRDGYLVVGDATSLPSGVAVTPAGQQTWNWAGATSDVRGLQHAAVTGRLAATWYGQTYTVDVAAGSTPRRIALYVVDWDTVTRSQRVDVIDAATGNVLDTKTVSGFSNGEYWIWEVSGNIRLRFTVLTGANAVVSGLFFDGGGIGADWHVSPTGTGNGTSAAPFGRIQDALNAAQPGQTILVAPGTYAESLQTVRNGTAAQRVVLRTSGGRGSVVVTSPGRVFTASHAYTTVDGFVFDGQYGADDTVRLAGAATGFRLLNTEVRRSSLDLIDMGAPSDVLVENCLIHHALNATGGRTDAHGIVAGAVRNLTVRDTEIHTFSGDGIQLDPGRSAPGWDAVSIERVRIWLAPLSAAENGFPAGTVAGENAVDTKAGAAFARARLVVRDSAMWGFRNGLIGNMAAFNLKENVEATIDGVTVSDSEIAFRTRGPNSGSPLGAWVTVKNAVVYNTATAFRYEDNIERLNVWHSTLGRSVATPFHAASSSSSGLNVLNLLVLGSLPSAAPPGFNLGVSAGAFVNAAADDYHLATTSPALDAGVALPDVTSDRDGVARPRGAGVDVGAYER